MTHNLMKRQTNREHQPVGGVSLQTITAASIKCSMQAYSTLIIVDLMQLL